MPVQPKSASHPDNRTLTLDQTAIWIGTSPRHMRDLARDGKLPFPVLRIGKRLMVSREAVERFLNGETAEDAQVA